MRAMDKDTVGGGKGSNALGPMPEWDLSDLYASVDAPEFTRDMAWLTTEAADFAKAYEGKLADLSAADMLTCIQRQEKMDMIAGRLMSFAGLRYYQQTTDGARAKFMGDAQAKMTDATTPLVFFNLELNRLPDAKMTEWLALPALARYQPIFERIRAMRPHQLSDELEKFLHDLSVTGNAWERLFDETMAGLEFEIDGEKMPLEAVLNLFSEQDRSLREKAAHELSRVLGLNLKLFARVHNTQAKEKEVVDRWRHMPTPMHGRHLSNHVEPEVVEALRNAVVAAYPKLSHRYYALKARWLGLDKLQIWDRNAPLPMESTRIIPWDEAVDMVMKAYGDFSPKLAEVAKPFFGSGWIDAAVKPGKAPGAFAHPTVSDAHPYLMLNYLGKPRDVMTLAHELGHGVHQRLAAKQGELLSSTPLTLAETASVFGEMLTFRALLRGAKTPQEKKILLAGKVEDMINTVVRQIAFYDFEVKLHAARREGELTPEDIGALWMSVQSESLGPAFTFMEGYSSFWAYVPHFVHSPFYVYAYAFGDSLVNALYAVYEEQGEAFKDKYFALLEAGGSKHHKDLLAPFGLDASDPAFWDKGLSMIAGMIDELEAMEG